jgi:hypothetical protein
MIATRFGQSSGTVFSRRHGMAAMWALVVLTFVSAVSAAILSEFGSARRQTDRAP